MRVALAEDQHLFREALAALLTQAGHEVLHPAADGGALLAVLAREPADVAILDIRMPPGSDGGLTTAETLRSRHPDVGLLMLSHYAERHFLLRVLEIGTTAIGYRLKDQIGSVEALSDTLVRICAGEIVIEPQLASRLVDQPQQQPFVTLTPRERDVMQLMAEGRSNKGIAGQLGASAKSVERHVARIFEKLNLPVDTAADNRRVLAVLTYWRSQQPGI